MSRKKILFSILHQQKLLTESTAWIMIQIDNSPFDKSFLVEY